MIKNDKSAQGAAKELFGMVNVAVVDCGGYNRELCRSIPQVTGFPSVLVYFGGKEPVKFSDNRIRKNFVKFAKRYVAGKPVDLWAGNLEEVISDQERINLPWLIYFDKMKKDIDLKILNSIGKWLDLNKIYFSVIFQNTQDSIQQQNMTKD